MAGELGGIEMNIAGEVQELLFGSHQDGFIDVLE